VDAWHVRAALELGLITPRQAELALDLLEVQLHDADPLRLAAPAPTVCNLHNRPEPCHAWHAPHWPR
jgi:hypothetical protein